ncbi:MAG: trypsin-like peptidase domain-containing protein [Actinomycetota bacterium]|nr:trypsin-like peptidase domain-containing protein [Actinomycetota bacterium]
MARTHRILRGVTVVGAVVLIAGCGSGSGSSKAAPQTTSGLTVSTNPAPQASTATGGAASLQQAFVSVVAKVRPEVVKVTSTSQGTTDLGSGIIYDNQGDIVTNAHVVGTAKSFQVTFSGGQTASATLVGAYTGGDLAVVKVAGGKSLPLQPATFGDSKALQIGDITLAIGNPLGFASSVTEGIVSFNGRSVAESNSVTLPSTVQTSAAINPGNSGGALVDLNGDVIGIPTLAATDQQQGGTAAGIGFAIPSNTVKLIVPQLISSGRVTNSGRAELGIRAGAGTGGGGQASGVVVVTVVAGGPADKAGIKDGDLITAINGKPTPSLADLQDILSTLTPGQGAKVTVQSQGGGGRPVNVTLGQLPG